MLLVRLSTSRNRNLSDENVEDSLSPCSLNVELTLRGQLTVSKVWKNQAVTVEVVAISLRT